MRFAAALCLVLAILYSCNDEPKTDDRLALLTGRWELIQAFRNDTETQTLAGTYFEFGKDGKMQTNLPVQAEPSTPYTLEKDKIKQGGPVPIDYTVKSLTATELTLVMELQGIVFDMRLRKN